MIFGKAFVGRTDGSEQTAAEICFSTDPIVGAALERVVEQTVDGEVAPECIGLRAGKADLVRMPAIGVIRLCAEGSHLEWFVRFHNQHDAELFADWNGMRKDAFDLVRASGGGHIVIVRSRPSSTSRNAASPPSRPRTHGLAGAGQFQRLLLAWT